MSNEMLPDYIKLASPNPPENRAPWYKNTAPAYIGIFLWIVFYREIATDTLGQAGLGLSLLGLLIAALLCHFLYYLIPGLLGMKTGYPLYVVGSSTYGTAGGFIIPGLLMGLLQFGWLAVNTAVSTQFILKAVDADPSPMKAWFIIVAIIWALVAVTIALKGIHYLGKVSTFIPIVPLVMIMIVFVANVGSAVEYKAAEDAKPLTGFLTMIAIVVGFFATAGAAGVDFGMANRNKKDVQLGGLFGISLAIIVAGGLSLIAIAGANASDPSLGTLRFDGAIASVGAGARLMFALFAIASFAPACFCSFIAANSITTMFPKLNRSALIYAGAVAAIILAATGWALNLISVFGIIGASFGPVCGSMAADYLLSGFKWSGPRKGVNWAGYIAWAVGFVVAILPMVKVEVFGFINPAPVIAFIIGFVLYIILAKTGLEPQVVSITPETKTEPERETGTEEAQSQTPRDTGGQSGQDENKGERQV